MTENGDFSLVWFQNAVASFFPAKPAASIKRSEWERISAKPGECPGCRRAQPRENYRLSARHPAAYNFPIHVPGRDRAPLYPLFASSESRPASLAFRTADPSIPGVIHRMPSSLQRRAVDAVDVLLEHSFCQCFSLQVSARSNSVVLVIRIGVPDNVNSHKYTPSNMTKHSVLFIRMGRHPPSPFRADEGRVSFNHFHGQDLGNKPYLVQPLPRII